MHLQTESEVAHIPHRCRGCGVPTGNRNPKVRCTRCRRNARTGVAAVEYQKSQQKMFREARYKAIGRPPSGYVNTAATGTKKCPAAVHCVMCDDVFLARSSLARRCCVCVVRHRKEYFESRSAKSLRAQGKPTRHWSNIANRLELVRIFGVETVRAQEYARSAWKRSKDLTRAVFGGPMSAEHIFEEYVAEIRLQSRLGKPMRVREMVEFAARRLKESVSQVQERLDADATGRATRRLPG